MSTIIPSTLAVFPTCPTYGFTVQPQYLVKLAMQEGGFEKVTRRWPRPLNVFTAVPIGPRDEEDTQAILYFWHAMGGRARTFVFKDYTDFKSCPVQQDEDVTDQPLMVTTLPDSSIAYQMRKLYKVGLLTQVREITNPVGETIQVANGTGDVQDDYTLDEDTGLLVPGGGFDGVPSTWGGEFNVPVRFDSELDMVIEDQRLQSANFMLREKRLAPPQSFGPGSP